jgi:hypothetical protein
LQVRAQRSNQIYFAVSFQVHSTELSCSGRWTLLIRSVALQIAWKEMVADLRNITELNNALGAEKDDLILANQALQHRIDEMTRERHTLPAAARKYASFETESDTRESSIENGLNERSDLLCAPFLMHDATPKVVIVQRMIHVVRMSAASWYIWE